MLNVLYADPDQSSIELVTAFIEFGGFTVISSRSLSEAAHIAESNPFLLFLTEFNFPGQNSLRFCRKLKHLFPKIPIICYSELATEKEVEEISLAGVDAFFRKPAINDLFNAVMLALGKHKYDFQSARRAPAE